MGYAQLWHQIGSSMIWVSFPPAGRKAQSKGWEFNRYIGLWFHCVITMHNLLQTSKTGHKALWWTALFVGRLFCTVTSPWCCRCHKAEILWWAAGDIALWHQHMSMLWSYALTISSCRRGHKTEAWLGICYIALWHHKQQTAYPSHTVIYHCICMQ